jgi:hypothetical protein
VIDQILLHWRAEGSLLHSEQEWLLDELDRLRTAHGAAVEDAKKFEQRMKWKRQTAKMNWDKFREQFSRAEALEKERDAALATGREQVAEMERLRHVLEIISDSDPSPLNPEGDDVCDCCVGLIETAAEALAAIPSPPKGCCEWRLESNRKVWTASCDRQSVVSPVSVQFKFCPTCGLPISIKAEEGKP